jgi:hypothetical protein
MSIDINHQRCIKLHKLFNDMRPQPLNGNSIRDIPFDKGIYVFFEKGEIYYGMDKIVRVGTHGLRKGNASLRNRLSEHHDDWGRSIFRRYVGTALLHRKMGPNHPDLAAWDYTRNERLQRAKLRNDDFYDSVERDISSYIRNHITFVCFPVAGSDDRKRLEAGIIATLSGESDFTSCVSREWLGRYVTGRTKRLRAGRQRISDNGLWLQQGLGKNNAPLSEEEFKRIMLTGGKCVLTGKKQAKPLNRG